MTRRKSRKSILYRPKGKGKAKTSKDGKEGAPDDRAWDQMHLFGAFSKSFNVDDENDDNQKYRFRRGDIATMLPSHVVPGEPIEPHEYWVGKILEIRADQGCMDSEKIWTKVQWLYSAEEAKALIPSLDISLFGKFERIWSDHWDFVYPHAFNEVITLPQLLTFPRTSPIPILPQSHPRTPKQQSRRDRLQRSREVSLLSSSSSSTPTTITTNAGSSSSSRSSKTTMTTVASASNASIPAAAPALQDLMAQRIIGPEMFYWRYTLSVEERILGPASISDSNCICSYPYRPDDVSLRGGVMIFCPRRKCGTGYHLGCLEDVNCVWVDDDDGNGIGKKCGGGKSVKGKEKGKEKIDVEETQNEEEEEERWLSKRAIRQISTSPNSNDAYIDLLSLLTAQPSLTNASTRKNMIKRGELIISLLERVYDRQLEQHYIYSQSEPPNPSQPPQKRRTKNLTANSLLATLFILPPPYPLSPSPTLSKQRQRQRQRQQQCELHLLLAVACQPLFRGGGCFEGLGPTGNVNAVLCAREFVWEVVRRIGEVDLEGGVGRGGGGGRGGKELSVQEFDEEEEERKDREDFMRIRECVETVLDGYRKKFFPPPTMDDDDNGPTRLTKELVVPLDGVIEDAIVVKKGLLFFDYLHRSRKSHSTSTLVDDEEDGEFGDDTEGDIDVEGGGDGDGMILGGDMGVKGEPLSDFEIVEETEQEEEEIRDDDMANTSTDETDNILFANPGKRKRSTTAMTRRRRNHYRVRKKLRMGVVRLGFGEGGDSDSDDNDEEDDEEDEEEDEEDIEDLILLNADWACPGCRKSI